MNSILFLTNHFIILEYPNPSSDVSEVHETRRSTDLGGSKIAKRSVGYIALFPSHLLETSNHDGKKKKKKEKEASHKKEAF